MPQREDMPKKLDYAPRPLPARRGPGETQKRIATPILVAGLALLLWGAFAPGPARFDLWTGGAGLTFFGALLRFV